MVLDRFFPASVVVIAIVEALLAAALVLEIPFAVGLWPISGTTRLTFLVNAAFLAAAATSQLWCVWRQELSALAGVALDYVTIAGPGALYLLAIGVADDDAGLTSLGATFIAGTAFGATVWVWSRRQPVRDQRPTPVLLIWSFAVFILVLGTAGAMMVFHIGDVIPWKLEGTAEVVTGMMFLGSAAYFAYGLILRGWHNAAGQMAGFLAYDLVLIVPLLRHFTNVPDDLMPNLIAYTGVIVLSGLLAAYFLFVNAETRVRHQAIPTIE